MHKNKTSQGYKIYSRGYICNYYSKMEWIREDRATMWVRMPDFKAPFTALALVLAEHLVEELEARGVERISSSELSAEMELNASQV